MTGQPLKEEPPSGPLRRRPLPSVALAALAVVTMVAVGALVGAVGGVPLAHFTAVVATRLRGAVAPRPITAAAAPSAAPAAAAPSEGGHDGPALPAPGPTTTPLALPLVGLGAAALAVAAGWVRAAARGPTPQATALLATTSRRPLNGQRLLVLGGSGYLGQRICRCAVKAGYAVTALSRRGAPPQLDPFLSEVEWRTGDATQPGTLPALVGEGFDAVVHAVGLLFDSQSGLARFNTIVSGSKSLPASDGTYDRVTRLTGETLVDALTSQLPPNKKFPVAFISAAEAGWPDVPGGPFMDRIVPDFLKRYLAAKRTVEGRLLQPNEEKLRPLIFRPSLMWDWTKWDVLPIIPVFIAANALGVPFVDRPMNVENIARAVVAGLEDDTASGVFRFQQMDELAARDKWEF